MHSCACVPLANTHLPTLTTMTTTTPTLHLPSPNTPLQETWTQPRHLIPSTPPSIPSRHNALIQRPPAPNSTNTSIRLPSHPIPSPAHPLPIPNRPNRPPSFPTARHPNRPSEATIGIHKYLPWSNLDPLGSVHYLVIHQISHTWR